MDSDERKKRLRVRSAMQGKAPSKWIHFLDFDPIPYLETSLLAIGNSQARSATPLHTLCSRLSNIGRPTLGRIFLSIWLVSVSDAATYGESIRINLVWWYTPALRPCVRKSALVSIFLVHGRERKTFLLGSIAQFCPCATVSLSMGTSLPLFPRRPSSTGYQLY